MGSSDIEHIRREGSKISDELIMYQLQYDNHVKGMKKLIELNFKSYEITYTRSCVVEHGLCFMRTDINYNNASFRIESSTIFPTIVNFIFKHYEEDFYCPSCTYGSIDFVTRTDEEECTECGRT
jgi:hypothetical protein